MAANLVRRYPPDQAHHLLNLSFAQYRADADVVRLETELEQTQARLAEARAKARCELGDIDEYRRLRESARGEGRARPSHLRDITRALESMKLGDVLAVAVGRVAVVSTARRKGGEIRLGAVTPSARRLALTARDFPAPPHPVGHIVLPAPYEPRSKRFLTAAAASLQAAKVRDAGTARRTQAVAAETHPCAECPDLRQHVRAAERATRLAAEAGRLERSIRSRTESLARQFDRVLRVLEAWGYVDGWALTAPGERLARIYHECDLLVAEALESGQLDGLEPGAVAALVSTFTYETRGPAGTGPSASFPVKRVRERWLAVEELAKELNRSEEEAGLPQTRPPEAGFVALAHGWATGKPLAEVLADQELAAGDFVRNIKQLIDLLRQLGELAPNPATAAAARRAADRVFRDVVAASSIITVDGDAAIEVVEP